MARKPRQRVVTTADVRDVMFPGKRATIAPLYQERNSGKVVLAVPGVLAEPYHAFKGLVDITKSTPPAERFGKDYANRVAGKALDVSGAVGVGGLASPKPAGAIGTFGGKAIGTFGGKAVGAAGTSRVIDSAGYFSAALEAARSLKQAKGTPEQMRAQLRSGGMTESEAAATKLDKFLEGKKSVTREELVQHLEENRTELREVIAYGRDNAPTTPAGEIPSPVRSAKYQRYSLNPNNPTYTETVLSLGEHPSVKALEAKRAEIDKLVSESGGVGSEKYHQLLKERDQLKAIAEQNKLPGGIEAFRSGHFDQPNIIGHYQSSIVKDAEGRRLLHLDQVQSDWGQRVRDKGHLDEAKIAEIQQSVDYSSTMLQEAREAAHAAGFSDKALEGYVRVPSTYELKKEKAVIIHDYLEAVSTNNRLKAELATAKQAPIGHPLVNTTDQWLNTTLRHALKSAVAAGADGIAVPKGKTVLGYNPGDTHGMETFYNQIVPKNLGKIIGKLDPTATAPHELFAVRSPETNRWFDGVKGGLAAAIPYDQIAASKGSPSFTAFYLTPKVKEGVITGGQPLFARHPTGGVVPGGGDKGDTGETFQRTYKTGPKAGTTEIVRKAK